MALVRRFHLSWFIYLLAIGARLLPGPRTIDDAYITFRYARNLLSGMGMVYNPGERVLGTTTPLYTFFMAGLGRLAGGSQAAFPHLSYLLNAGLAGLTIWLLIRLGEQLGFRRAGLATAFIWAIGPMSVTFDIGGMETGFIVLLMTATFYFALRDRTWPAAVLGALSLLTRPDALLFIGLLGLERLRRAFGPRQMNPHRLPIRLSEILAFGLPIVAWTILSSAYFGSPLPHSMTAKVAAYRLPAEAGLVRLLQHYATPFLGHLTFGTAWIGVGLLLHPTLFGLGALMCVREKPSRWPFFVYPWFYLAAFAIANPLIFRWYLTPPLPAYFLGIFLGAERIARDLRIRWLPLVLALSASLLTLRGWTLVPDHGPALPAPRMAFIELELMYEEIGLEMRETIGQGAVLAAGDIGALGYYSGARMLDTVGLITPASLPFYPIEASAYAINYAIPTDLVLELEPDFLVILEAYGRHTLLADPAFQARYSQIGMLPTEIYGSRGLLIFERMGRP